MSLTYDPKAIIEALDVFMDHGQVVEVRALNVQDKYRKVTVSGYYDSEHIEVLAEHVSKLGLCSGVYFTMNPVNPALLARAENRLRVCAKDDPTTADKDITSRRWLMLDFDAVRPAGISASDEEKAASFEVAAKAKAHLQGLGWPDPVEGDSGNGGHLHYRIDLPADDEGLVKACLEKLQELFGTEQVKVDGSVFNPSRISKLPGTPVRKGDNTAERPHRMARIISAPIDPQVVPAGLLKALAAIKAPSKGTPKPKDKAKKGGKPSTFDMAAWIEKFIPGEVKGPFDYEGGQKWLPEVCPMNPEHTDGSAMIFSGPEGQGFKCHHDGCKDFHWAELRRKYDKVQDLGSARNLFGGFYIQSSGLFFRQDDEEDTKPLRICAPLEVTACTRDSLGNEWGRLLEWSDPDGTPHEWAMPMYLLKGDCSDLRGHLLDGGLDIAPGRKSRELLASYLSTAKPKARALAVDRVGWHGETFILPGAAIGQPEGERLILQTVEAPAHTFNCMGTLEEWQAKIGRFAVRNSRLAFGLSIAFAGPLLSLLNRESLVVHLKGPSSTGKTTVGVAAGSVWGGPRYHETWRATDNALEGTALAHNDGLLVLDELGEMSSKDAGRVVYMLVNGQGKGRMRDDTTTRKRKAWTLAVISNGELGLAEHMAEGGNRARVGQELRMLEIPAMPEGGHGMWENLHGFPSGDALSDHLKRAARECYGNPIHAFLEYLTQDLSAILPRLKALQQAYIAKLDLAEGADGQVSRAAGHFALIAAAGELATSMGVLPWPRETALEAAKTCFKAWVEQRGGSGRSEIDKGISQVLAFLEAHGPSRFENPWVAEDESPRMVLNRAGFRKRLEGDGGWDYFILTETFKTEICKGFDHKLILAALEKKGLFVRGDKGAADSKRFPSNGVHRVYYFPGFRLSAHATEQEGVA